MKDYSGQTVFIAGGSSGLGKAIALILASRGAHVTIFARDVTKLEDAKMEIMGARAEPTQEVYAISLDMSNAAEVERVFRAQLRCPDALYCLAGGASHELGFFSDLSPEIMERTMRNNYLTSVYPAQTLWRMWTEQRGGAAELDAGSRTKRTKTRSIVFVSSAAAFVGFPGYVAYTPAKYAVRGLAETLRQEALRVSDGRARITVHCAFPSNFVSPAFRDEQETKPALLRRMEGTDAPMRKLERRLHSAEQVAAYVVRKVERGDFCIVSEAEAALLWGGVLGLSPRRGLGVVDFVVGLFGLVAFPVLRRYLDRIVVKDGKGKAVGAEGPVKKEA